MYHLLLSLCELIVASGVNLLHKDYIYILQNFNDNVVCNFYFHNSTFILLCTIFPTILNEVCDEPHPLLIKEMLNHCVGGNIEDAYIGLKSLWDKGYSSRDIIVNIFRVCKNLAMPEYLKLEFIKVRLLLYYILLLFLL